MLLSGTGPHCFHFIPSLLCTLADLVKRCPYWEGLVQGQEHFPKKAVSSELVAQNPVSLGLEFKSWRNSAVSLALLVQKGRMSILGGTWRGS